VQSIPPIDLKCAESSTSRSVLEQTLKEETSETLREKRPKKNMIDLDTLHIDIHLQEMPWLMCDKQSPTISDKNIILKGYTSIYVI